MINISNEFIGKFDNNIIKYSIILIPFFLITGPFIPDLIVSSIAIYFLYYSLKFKNFIIFKNKYFKVFLVFLLICILSSLLSEHKLYSIKTSSTYFRFGIFVFVFYLVLSKDESLLFKLWIVLFLCYLSLTLDGFYQFFFKENILGFKANEIRLSSFFGDELILGSYLSRFFPLFYGLYLLPSINKRLKYKIFINLLITLSVVLIYLSGERTAFFFICASLLFLTITLNSNKKALFYKILIIIISIMIFFNFNQSTKQRMINQTIDQIGLKSEKIYIFSREHEGHYLVAIDLIKSNLLFGIGPKNFRKYCYLNQKYSEEPYICTSHPHNTYLQLFLETGIIGFFIVLSIFIFFIIEIFRHIFLKIRHHEFKYNNFQLCLICSFLITLWPFIPSGNFFNNFLSIIYFYPIAIFLNSFKTKY